MGTSRYNSSLKKKRSNCNVGFVCWAFDVPGEVSNLIIFLQQSAKYVFHFSMHPSRYFLFPSLKISSLILVFLAACVSSEHCSMGKLMWGKPDCNLSMPLSNSPKVTLDLSPVRMCFWQGQTVCMGKLKHFTPHASLPCSNLILKSRHTKLNMYFSHLQASCSVMQ